MIDCKIHGLSESIFCCPHVDDASEKGRPCEIAGYTFDYYGTGFLVCPSCLEPARQFVEAQTDEEIEASSFHYELQCLEHLKEWLEKKRYPSLATLRAEERKRTGRPPE